jgi:hypothetical protein
MADAALPTAKYPSYTTTELAQIIAHREAYTGGDSVTEAMRAEIARRALVLAGVTAVMTPSERLRHVKAGG